MDNDVSATVAPRVYYYYNTKCLSDFILHIIRGGMASIHLQPPLISHSRTQMNSWGGGADSKFQLTLSVSAEGDEK
jgi:hypothetical protein